MPEESEEGELIDDGRREVIPGLDLIETAPLDQSETI